MTLDVILHPFARADLFDLYSYIEERSGPERAGTYVDRIESLCKKLSAFPHRGKERLDLGPGVRTIALERRVLVVYRPSTDHVEILRVIYAGQDLAPEDVP